MKKKVFSVVFTFLFILLTVISPFTANAYEITSFSINAKECMLASLDTGEILYSQNSDDKIYPASITKIMTVTLILESDMYNPDSTITMTQDILNLVLGTGSAVSNIKAGEEITHLDLIYLILMASYGDCAYLGAQVFGGSVDEFVNKMNQKADELGLPGTHYSNPVGLQDEQTYTTVTDIHTLTVYALKNETFKTVCESARYTMPATNMSAARTLSTTNFLQDTTTNYYYQYAKGVKTGYTDEAGRCLVSTASFNGYNYICITMGCPPNAGKRYEFIDSKNLYRWAFNNFSFKEIANTDNPICEMPVKLSLDTDFVPLYIQKSLLSVLPNDADDSTVIIKPYLNSKSIDAPVKKGQVLGKADIIYAEQKIGTVDLVAGSSIKASKLLIAAKAIKNVFSSIYMKLLLTLAIVAFLIFIMLCIKLNIKRIKKRKVKYVPYKEEIIRRTKH